MRLISSVPSQENVVACLASIAIGAIWVSAASDFGPAGVLERFEQVAPKVIFSVDKVVYVVDVQVMIHAADGFIGTTARFTTTCLNCGHFSKVWQPKTCLQKQSLSCLRLLIPRLCTPAGLQQRIGLLGEHSFRKAGRNPEDEIRTEKLSGIELRSIGPCGFCSAPEQLESPSQSSIAPEECYFKR
jgi:hypothetical protein